MDENKTEKKVPVTCGGEIFIFRLTWCKIIDIQGRLGRVVGAGGGRVQVRQTKRKKRFPPALHKHFQQVGPAMETCILVKIPIDVSIPIACDMPRPVRIELSVGKHKRDATARRLPSTMLTKTPWNKAVILVKGVL